MVDFRNGLWGCVIAVPWLSVRKGLWGCVIGVPWLIVRNGLWGCEVAVPWLISEWTLALYDSCSMVDCQMWPLGL